MIVQPKFEVRNIQVLLFNTFITYVGLNLEKSRKKCTKVLLIMQTCTEMVDAII